HYCLGMIQLHQGRDQDAYIHFAAVMRMDPSDAHAWYHCGLTHPAGRDSAEAHACFRKALALNPYLNAARYALAIHPKERENGNTGALLEEFKNLKAAEWEAEAQLAYLKMGRYAEVIGRTSEPGRMPVTGPLPLFDHSQDLRAELAPITRWATSNDFG